MKRNVFNLAKDKGFTDDLAAGSLGCTGIYLADTAT